MPALNLNYEKDGYFVEKGLFNRNELSAIQKILENFHELWKAENSDFYQNKAINSAYLTGTKYLSSSDRRALFQFIASKKIQAIVGSVIPTKPAFLNTQLFFDPFKAGQKNYWHRDLQYLGKPIEEQKKMLNSINVIHFRIPLKQEYGIEIVPGSHKEWDTNVEFDIRTEANGKKCFETLPTGKIVKLEPGDLMIFSANMIHRGLYGLDRLSFDIIFCDSDPELVKHAELDTLPNEVDIQNIEFPNCFLNTIKLKNQYS
jgi:ectoine hydroxylase-related dioxygenase (phytanoyl-CoA dioxygenase family)